MKGFKTTELLNALEHFVYKRMTSSQVCELSPDYDNSDVSAQVAATSAYEIMCLALNNVN